MPPTPNRELTTFQKQLYEFYCKHSDEHGAPPTVGQIADALGMQRSSIYQALASLEAKGFLRKKPITIKRLMPVKRKAAP